MTHRGYRWPNSAVQSIATSGLVSHIQRNWIYHNDPLCAQTFWCWPPKRRSDKAAAFVPNGSPVSFAQIGKLIGNAVPVHLGKAIGNLAKQHAAEHE